MPRFNKNRKTRATAVVNHRCQAQAPRRPSSGMLLRAAARRALRPQLRCVASRSDDDGHSKTAPSKRSEDLVRYALAGNLAIAGAKGAVALTTGSAAMLAETVHSCADAGNQALLLIGLHASSLAPSASHPYGYGKSVYYGRS